ncbi:hypothetical protein BC828DRAFT_419548 [Blastocladiella britannica]|nr:hypothetical protein BC828DRAFT_419548 [Blastocladiella britannica]
MPSCAKMMLLLPLLPPPRHLIRLFSRPTLLPPRSRPSSRKRRRRMSSTRNKRTRMRPTRTARARRTVPRTRTRTRTRMRSLSRRPPSSWRSRRASRLSMSVSNTTAFASSMTKRASSTIVAAKSSSAYANSTSGCATSTAAITGLVIATAKWVIATARWVIATAKPTSALAPPATVSARTGSTFSLATILVAPTASSSSRRHRVAAAAGSISRRRVAAAEGSSSRPLRRLRRLRRLRPLAERMMLTSTLAAAAARALLPHPGLLVPLRHPRHPRHVLRTPLVPPRRHARISRLVVVKAGSILADRRRTACACSTSASAPRSSLAVPRMSGSTAWPRTSASSRPVVLSREMVVKYSCFLCPLHSSTERSCLVPLLPHLKKSSRQIYPSHERSDFKPIPGREHAQASCALALHALRAQSSHLGIVFSGRDACLKHCTVTLTMGSQVATRSHCSPWRGKPRCKSNSTMTPIRPCLPGSRSHCPAFRNS